MEALIHKLSTYNIDVDVVNDQLKLQIPEGIDAAAIVEEVKQHKEALISFIRQIRDGKDFSGIMPCEEKEYYALSAAQQRLYFLYEFDRLSLAYNMPQVISVKGRPDKEKLDAAMNALVARHESLRTTFSIMNGEPVQRIAPATGFQIEYTDPGTLESAPIIQKFIRPFNLEQGPLFRIGVITLPDSWVLMVDIHHIITDGISGDVMLRDFQALYNNLPLQPLRLQYKDYAEWQQRPEQQAEMAAQAQFWLRELNGPLPVLALPADFTRPLKHTHRGAHFAFDLGVAETAALRGLAAGSGATLFMVVLAVYNILLGKLSNQEDVIIGTPLAGRPHADLEQIIGMFVNVLALRNYPAGGYSFRTFLDKVKKHTLACFDHQLYQFEDLVNALKIKRDSARNPLFDVFYVYEYGAGQPAQEGGNLFRPISSGHTVSKFDLTLLAVETDAQLQMRFEYAADLFNEATIERFANYFKRIVAAIAADADVQLSAISLLSAEECRQLTDAYNNTYFDYPAGTNIITLFEEQAKKNPDGTALLAAGAAITYKELDARATQLAIKLHTAGMQAGGVIAILQERTVNWVAGVLAALKNGGVYLPVDTALPDERIQFMLNDGGAVCLLSETAYMQSRSLKAPQIFLLDELHMEARHPEDLPALPSHNHNDLYIIYTSGSTGTPKGVTGSQRGLLNRLYWGWDRYPYAAGEVCCLKTSLGFVDHVAELFSPLLAGVPLVIAGNHETQNIAALADLLAINNITRITLVPSVLQSLIRLKRNRYIQLQALKYVFCSGEELPFYLARQFYREFGQARLVNIYGSSEVGADVTCYNVDRFNVEEVLTYFRQSAVAGETDFTTGHVPLQSIAARFMNSSVAAYPVTLEEYYQRLYRDVLPYTINTASPTFIGHMTSVLPDYVHDLSKLISRLNQNLVKVETSKSVTFLEREAIAMLHRLFYDMPAEFYAAHIQKLNANLGIITSGGSTANISALLAARNKALYGAEAAVQGSSIYARLQELGYRDMVVIGTSLMHYSFKKAMSVLGLGAANIMPVQHDANGRMDTDDLERQIAVCSRQRLLVIAIVGIAGSTERGGIDPLQETGSIARRHGIHFHVDAAWGGALMFSDRYRKLLHGIRQADTITCCGHKQLYLPQGISICLFRDPGLLSYNAVTANYQAAANSYDTGRFTIEGSRPALSLCLHASLNVLGKKGYELLIDGNMERAVQFATLVKEIPAFELLSCQINIINYRYIPAAYRSLLQQGGLPDREQNETINEINTGIQEYQFYKGNTFVSRTTIDHPVYGKCVVFRVVLSNPLTGRDDLLQVLKDQLLVVNELYGEAFDPGDITRSLPVAAVMEEESASRYEQEKIPVGKPLYNTQIYILDKYLQLQPPGVPGEICVAGDALANGYTGSARQQETAFVNNPFCANTRLYRTGDLGKWLPDGNIIYLGRIDRQVKIRGIRIEPGEIEQAIYGHESVVQAAVIVKEKQGEQYLVAFYVAETALAANELRDFLSSTLPVYMLPAQYMQLAELPLTASGKTDRRQLLTIEGGDVAQRIYEAPATPTEILLAKVWEDLFGITGIGVQDDFFEIGGHSLSAIRLAAAVKREMKVAVPLNVIFQLGNIKRIAAWIDVACNEAAVLPDDEYEEIKL